MQFFAIISENIKNNMQKNKDISMHILKQRFIIFLLHSGFADTSFVALILNPPDTKTHISVYTQKISWYIPMPSAPIMFERYILKKIPMLLKISAVKVSIKVFFKKSFFCTKSPPSAYMQNVFMLLYTNIWHTFNKYFTKKIIKNKIYWRKWKKNLQKLKKTIDTTCFYVYYINVVCFKYKEEY